MAGNTQDKRVNDQRVRGLKDKGTLTESLPGRGTGSILFKKVGTVTTAYYRWNLNKKPGHLSIGQYASTPSSPGMKLSEIREEATRLARILMEHGNPKEYLARQAKAKAEHESQRKAEEARSQVGTFADLLRFYAADMARRGKTKAKEVARMFEMHVIEKFPDLAAKPARDVTAAELKIVLRNVLNSKPANRGKGNTTQAPVTSMKSTTDTLHTYLCAAYESAKTGEVSIDSDEEEESNFDISFNPAAAVRPLKNVYNGDTESLQQSELRELLLYFDGLPERHRAIALAPIYLAGQRLKMLLDLRWEHIDDEGLLVFDKKGREDPLPHFLPITQRVREILEPLFQQRTSQDGPFAITKNLVNESYASKFYSTAGRELSEAGKSRYFTWREVRATAETIIAGLGITEEARAHLLSHGREGVQAKFYDRNAYLREKTEALHTWCEFLDNLKLGIFRPDIKILKLSDIRPKSVKPAK